MDYSELLNFAQLSDEVATSGQPRPEQFPLIAEGGYQVVINLAMPDSPGALAHEEQLVTHAGMAYFAIPVPWEQPSPAHLQAFIDLMEQVKNKKVWVHCALNYRVSAFMNRYAALVEGVPRQLLRSPMFDVWQPEPRWQAFLAVTQQQLEEAAD